jgi:hypothetical protein
MKCQKCEKPMIVEALDDNRKRFKCNECGILEIRDGQDRKYLTSDQPAPQARPLLG